MEEGEGGGCTPKNASSSEAVAVASAAATTPLDVTTKKLARQLDFTAFTEHSQSQLHSPLTPQPVVVMPVLPSPHPSVRVGKPESPKSRPNFEVKDATPKKQKQCNCKHSKCLKL